MKIVQIGTNNGDDHVRDLCKEIHPDFILLVEPFSIHNPEIHRHYAEIPNYRIENITITTDSDSRKPLFFCEADGPIRGPGCNYHVSSIDPAHLVKHGYAADTLRTVEVPAMTLNELLATHRCEQLDFLFLDVEGIDFEVLKSIDFERFDITHLQVEHLHLNREQLLTFMASKGFSPLERGIDYHGYDTMFRKQVETGSAV